MAGMDRPDAGNEMKNSFEKVKLKMKKEREEIK